MTVTFAVETRRDMPNGRTVVQVKLVNETPPGLRGGGLVIEFPTGDSSGDIYVVGENVVAEFSKAA